MMKRAHPLIVAAVIAGIAVVSAPLRAVACGMTHGASASAPPEESQRVEDLRAKLKANSAAIASNEDQAQVVELLKERTALQDALLAATMPAPGRPAGAHSGTRHDHP